MLENFLKQFHESFCVNAYDYLGSFVTRKETTFRVYAPHATSVSVVGDFNRWCETENPMRKIDERGIWEVTIPELKVFSNYKYAIYNKTMNKKVYKQDPYAKYNEAEGGHSSRLYDIEGYKWFDNEWMEERKTKNVYKNPMNIYEVNLGSWKKTPEGGFLSYRTYAEELVEYCKKMGYNYIELMPITEYPYLGSWGYQSTGYFSPSSRFGLPEDFMYFVDKAHQSGIGIIMDWVPAHFPKDDFGLCEFDGEYLYEDSRPTRMEYPTWGTRIFNYSKPEVKSFLLSSANLFFEKYHIDGLRVDAVAAMLYLDYDRKKWIPNIYGGNYNLETIDFLKTLNMEMFKKHGNILMIAEESTAFPKVTYPVYDGGLGFNFKWSMGWMNDTLTYMKIDPLFRKYEHNKLTFAMTYAFSENYILPLSHDEVVHGKKSLVDKMPGEYDEKFANLRTYYAYMMTHPGKKLLFMGGEFGQFIEWDEKKELDWFLLKYPRHTELQRYVKRLNHLYLRSPNLYAIDNSWDGFEWIYADDYDHNTYVYVRKYQDSRDIIVVLNFSGADIIDYEIHYKPLRGLYTLVLNSDDYKYGGRNFIKEKEFKAKKGVLKINIPKLSALILEKKY